MLRFAVLAGWIGVGAGIALWRCPPNERRLHLLPWGALLGPFVWLVLSERFATDESVSRRRCLHKGPNGPGPTDVLVVSDRPAADLPLVPLPESLIGRQTALFRAHRWPDAEQLARVADGPPSAVVALTSARLSEVAAYARTHDYDAVVVSADERGLCRGLDAALAASGIELLVADREALTWTTPSREPAPALAGAPSVL